MMDGFIEDRIEHVILCGGFLFLQSLPITKQGHSDIWICDAHCLEVLTFDQCK